MAQLGSSSPAQPLSVGDVVSASIRLYRSHFKSYLGIAAMAVLWVLIPLVTLIPIVFLMVGAIDGEQSFNPLIPLLLAAWLVFLLYGLAQYLANSALISRLVFGELAEQPESVATARRYTQTRRWNFLWLSVLLGFLLTAVFLGFYLLIILLFLLSAIVIGGGAAFGVPTAGINNPILFALLGLLAVVLFFVMVGVLCWISARLAVSEVPLAVEDGVRAAASIRRSWKLSQKNALRILLVLLVAFLITLPLQAIVQIGVLAIQTVLGAQLEQTSPLYTSLSVLLGYILSFAVSIVIIPFWQAIKAVIYYDLRSRREGLGLALRDRTQGDY
ncbi:MAG: DUF975 domain-containing protein [Leptolyngbyaceae cyanobacterium SL_7_1]|nr:DUF975 domain-containing protein [Leptolyngbyaceae cyanobacterium SL_7_1]